MSMNHTVSGACVAATPPGVRVVAGASPRQKRRTGDQLSKLSDMLAVLAGSKCIASYIRDEHGDVFMILMADGCPACVEAKRQLHARRQQPEARPA